MDKYYLGWGPIVKSEASKMQNRIRSATVSGLPAVGVVLIGAMGLPTVAFAEWTVTRLNSAGIAYGVSGTQQVGHSTGHAMLWNGSASSQIDLHPVVALNSVALGVFDGEQVGQVQIGDAIHASLWTGLASSWVDLHPLGATQSAALGVFAGQQAGYAHVDGVAHASFWTGSASSWVDLHPAGSRWSSASGIGDGQQVGGAQFGESTHDHASLWTGSAASWVDLSPVGATYSCAVSASGGQQVGNAFVNGIERASLWSGSAVSWVDLNPPGATESAANGVFRGQQVGYVRIGDAPHASLWNGSPSSWLDLHGFLPPEFTSSVAKSIWSDVRFTRVVGYGVTSQPGGGGAILWTLCHADFDDDGTLDFFDYDAFVVAFEVGEPGSDFDHDGATDFFDYDEFVRAFESGC
ncbi:MAG: hypothetical protein AABZ53_11885 [Planctomycetota bacterium]